VNRQVMRLNQTVYCDGCGSNVNPYVLERKKDAEGGVVGKVECPNCQHTFNTELPDFDDKT